MAILERIFKRWCLGWTGSKYEINIEVISEPKTEYQTDEYFALDLPIAPAIMVNNEIVIEGGNVSQEEVETCICRHLKWWNRMDWIHFNDQGGMYDQNATVYQREPRLSELS